MSPDPEGRLAGLLHQETPVVITERHQKFFLSSLRDNVCSCLLVATAGENVRMQEVWNESEVRPCCLMTQAGGVNTTEHCDSSSKG